MPRGPQSTSQVTKQALLEAGARVMLQKGYSNTGIQEVLESTGVPKGSFYHYFDSKEDFGLQVIEHFYQNYAEKLRHYLDDKKYNAVERLKNYCVEGMSIFETNQCKSGCLIGNLSQEMSDQSEALRAK